MGRSGWSGLSLLVFAVACGKSEGADPVAESGAPGSGAGTQAASGGGGALGGNAGAAQAGRGSGGAGVAGDTAGVGASAGLNGASASAGSNGASASSGAGGTSSNEGGASNDAGANSAAGGSAQAGAGLAGMGNASGNGLVPATCGEHGACEAATCASTACFDADHCAVSVPHLWGTDADEFADDLAIGPDGARFLGGSARPSEGPSDAWDLLVVKLAPDGSEIWSWRWGTDARQNGYTVLVDGAGNSYLAGMSEGEVDGQANVGEYDVLVVKLDSDGEKVWSLLFGTAGGDSASDLAFDADGNVLVAGTWNRDATADSNQAFVATVSPGGALLDNFVLPIDGNPAAEAIRVDEDANWFITGETDHDDTSLDLFALKLSPAREVTWLVQWGSLDADRVYGTVVDAGGDLLIGGITDGSIDGFPAPKTGNFSALLTRISRDGERKWTRQYGGGTGLDMRGGALALAENGDVLLAGTVLGELMLDTPSLGADSFLMRLCPDGSVKSIQQWGLGGDDWCWGAAEDLDGHPVIAGYASNTPASGTLRQNDVFVVTVAPE